MMDQKTKDGLERFLASARRYVALIDSADALSASDFLMQAGALLLELYLSALSLPDVEPDSSDIADVPFEVDEWAGLLRALREKLGSLDLYWEVYDSTEKDEPVAGSLAGDISEIYSDMRESLAIAGLDRSDSDKLWELRYAFRTHWGRHTTSAVKAIHDRWENHEIG